MKLIILSSLLLTGCCSLIEPKVEPPTFDTYLMEYCKTEMAKMPEDIKDWNTVWEYKAKDNALFAECVNRHKGLVDSVKEYDKKFK